MPSFSRLLTVSGLTPLNSPKMRRRLSTPCSVVGPSRSALRYATTVSISSSRVRSASRYALLAARLSALCPPLAAKMARSAGVSASPRVLSPSEVRSEVNSAIRAAISLSVPDASSMPSRCTHSASLLSDCI
ncbi:Uncharacterised protein [Mycobacteroides abscessus subsp. abscessus]|nr:Uncharacterised protein [Mycobacteroides abscessus subsp. abscessus]